MENLEGEREARLEKQIHELKDELRQDEHKIERLEKEVEALEHRVELVFVNAVPKPWCESRISYREVVILEYGVYDENPDIIYHVSYSKGVHKKPQGILDKGDSIQVKDKMRFLVTKTDRS